MVLNKLLLTTLSILLLAMSSCDKDQTGAGNGPFGAPVESPLLSAFSGAWTFDFDKTLDARKAAGAKEEELEQLRKYYSDNPQIGSMHPDMRITGNEAVCSGIPSSEYRFFAMHQHDDKVCGKAWHHEDRFDPGDMSKCYVRLAIVDNHLYLDLKMKEGFPDLQDPDLMSMPPVEFDSAARCNADSTTEGDWSEWMTFVFRR